MISDVKIIEGCIANKRKAQKILFQKYNAVMLGLCSRYSKNIMEAEDVMMEGFMIVYSKIKNYKGEGSFEGWIKRIMINTAINNYRSNFKHYFHYDVDEIEESIKTVNINTEKTDEKIIIKVIQSLPDGHRLVFNFYAVEGYSHKEIAEMLDIAESTSKSQLSKARKILRDKLTVFK